MKKILPLSGDLYKTCLRKAIALMLLAAVVTIQPAEAQENRGQGREANDRHEGNRQQTPERQGMHGNREQMPAASRQDTRTPNDYNHNRPPVNAGSGQPNVANRTPHNVYRSPTIQNNTTNISVHNTVRVNKPRPVYSAGNPGWRYANMPRRNSVVTTLPPVYRTINYGGFNYRYNHGVFYRPYNNTFMVVAPPIGIYINTLPVGYRTINVGNYPYYYYNGTYYDYRNNNYLVVSPPVGAVVESLPVGYQTLSVDGQTYYTVDGTQYRPVVQQNGEIWYEVIKAN